jgi:hypothetical protein
MQGPEVPPPKKARNHGKRHSTWNRERSYEARQKAAASARMIAENEARRRFFNETVAAYYRGELADLSSIDSPCRPLKEASMNVVEFPKPKAKCSRCNDTGERPLGPLVMSGKVIPG